MTARRRYAIIPNSADLERACVEGTAMDYDDQFLIIRDGNRIVAKFAVRNIFAVYPMDIPDPKKVTP